MQETPAEEPGSTDPQHIGDILADPEELLRQPPDYHRSQDVSARDVTTEIKARKRNCRLLMSKWLITLMTKALKITRPNWKMLYGKLGLTPGKSHQLESL